MSDQGLERVRHALRATGANLQATSPLRTGIHSRGYLPHVKREGASYFVTFRLADSLPKAVLERIQAERAAALHQLSTIRQQPDGRACPSSAATEAAIEREDQRKIEQYLDRGTGACYLRRAEIADLVTQALHHFDGERYWLKDWVVMPNPRAHRGAAPPEFYVESDCSELERLLRQGSQQVAGTDRTTILATGSFRSLDP